MLLLLLGVCLVYIESIVQLDSFFCTPSRHLFWLPPPLPLLELNFNVAIRPNVSIIVVICHYSFGSLFR